MEPEATSQAALREWLRNERRLGIRHYGVAAAPGLSATAPKPAAADRPAGGPKSSTSPRYAATAAPHPPFAASSSAPVAPNQAASAAPPRSRGGGSATQAFLLRGADVNLPPMCDCDLPPEDARAALDGLNTQFVAGCKKCGLHAQRTQTVFGVGNPRAELVFVGEGPGADEDAQGEPFVGKAGQLLTRMIAAMTLTRAQVYICNVVKCRPPGNRTPEDDEMEACSPYLFRQLAILRPKVIVTLGRPATQTLLATKAAIGSLRGQWHDFPPPALSHLGLPACKLMPTFHPAYLLRSPGEKGKTWSDLKMVMAFFGIAVPGGA